MNCVYVLLLFVHTYAADAGTNAADFRMKSLGATRDARGTLPEHETEVFLLANHVVL